MFRAYVSAVMPMIGSAAGTGIREIPAFPEALQALAGVHASPLRQATPGAPRTALFPNGLFAHAYSACLRRRLNPWATDNLMTAM